MWHHSIDRFPQNLDFSIRKNKDRLLSYFDHEFVLNGSVQHYLTASVRSFPFTLDMPIPHNSNELCLASLCVTCLHSGVVMKRPCFQGEGNPYLEKKPEKKFPIQVINEKRQARIEDTYDFPSFLFGVLAESF